MVQLRLERARLPALPAQGRGFIAYSSCRVVPERRLQEPIVQVHRGLPLSERIEKSVGSDGTARPARCSGNALFLSVSIHAQKRAGGLLWRSGNHYGSSAGSLIRTSISTRAARAAASALPYQSFPSCCRVLVFPGRLCKG